MEDANAAVSPTVASREPPPQEIPGGDDVVIVGANGSTPASFLVKRKRGRPRKSDYSGANASVLTATSSPPPVLSDGSTKRGRGRPKGSGKLQILASSLGRYALDTAGGSFTPHVMTIPTGEDIVRQIISLAQTGLRAVCVLSAVGAVSNATIRQPSGVLFQYEGRFEILTLSGSYVTTTTSVSSLNCKSGMLSISLARPDGTVFGGNLGGQLIAAQPVQLTVGSFKQDIGRLLKSKLGEEASSVAMTSPPSKADTDTTIAIISTENGGATREVPIAIDATPISTLQSSVCQRGATTFDQVIPPTETPSDRQPAFPDSDNILRQI